MTNFTIESARAEASVVLNAHGTLSIGVGDAALRDAIHSAMQLGNETVSLNMAGVRTIDSSGVGELVSAYTWITNRGGRLILAGLPATVSDIMIITQLITVFEVFETPEEAIHDVVSNPGAAAQLLEFLAKPSESSPDLFFVSRDEPEIIQPVLIECTELILQALAREPGAIYELTPRRFEEVIASLIEDMGWEVHLTPASRDGGRDIMAFLPTELGRHLCLVEAKRYSRDRKVGVGLVRQLYGAVNHEEATSGL